MSERGGEPLRGPVFIVEDEAELRESLADTLSTAGFRVTAFPDAESFLGSFKDHEGGILILDATLPGMSGIELQAELARRLVPLPIVFLTGTATIPFTVEAVQRGAQDVLTKPVDAAALIERLSSVLERHHQRRMAVGAALEALKKLTAREREVAELVAQGLANKDVATRLGISHRTVEVHRANIMHKLSVSSAVELSRMLSTANDSHS